MKISLVIVFLINTLVCYSQWTRVTELPASIIFSLYHHNNTLYAGGLDKIYIGRDHGNTWDSSAIILPASRSVDAIISFKGWLYVAFWSQGVFRSNDNGKTWQNAGTGIFPFVSQLSEWRGNLYASTIGNAIYRLDSITLNSWIHYSEGMSDLSANCNTLAGNSNVLIATTRTNGIYNRLEAFSSQWEEKLITGNIRPLMVGDQIFSSNDSLFLSTLLPANVFRSTDNGISWQAMGPSNQFNDGVTTSHMAITNSRQAVVLARSIFVGGINFSTLYYKNKNTALQEPWILFDSLLPFTFNMAITGNKLWTATSLGLFYRHVQYLTGEIPIDSPKYTFSIGPVYPNPAKRNCSIAITLDQQQPLSAHLYDAVGRMVAVIADERLLNTGSTIITFDMSRYAAGVYFLKLTIAGKVVMREIVRGN